MQFTDKIMQIDIVKLLEIAWQGKFVGIDNWGCMTLIKQ